MAAQIRDTPNTMNETQIPDRRVKSALLLTRMCDRNSGDIVEMFANMCLISRRPAELGQPS